MSPRDGDLIKTVLLNAAEGSARRLRVLEWGSGQSTLSFAQILAAHDLPFQWLALEYDREYFDTFLAPALLYRADTILRYPDDDRSLHGPVGDGRAHIEAVCWNRTALRPSERSADREADLDDYVNYPAATGRDFDVVLVDGRKRRRCLLAAADFMETDTVVMLHDARHPHYHPPLARYPASRFIGDDLWVGARIAARLDDVLAERAAMPATLGYRWHLRRVMAGRKMFETTELAPLLAERGVMLSREQVHRLFTGVPERLNPNLLVALCDILDCQVGDLIEPARQAHDDGGTR
ncbi:helix-turn-helix transcriptional regulator [Streptomyces sp. NPDC001508]|uniref:helix-turn-helix domain-containing protein n=1 Tax=Streptomyces sp. NPDC001508 TaxID=3154656 RepID=UPI00331C92E8